MSVASILLLMLLIIGSIIIYMQFKLSDEKCPPERIIYRYVPRTFKEEQKEPVDVQDLFGKLFKDQPDILMKTQV
ncbi:MAG: hypothetical protein RLZZ546_2285 [Bacteroidota bacterium]|jgi:hypothetical protein